MESNHLSLSSETIPLSPYSFSQPILMTSQPSSSRPASNSKLTTHQYAIPTMATQATLFNLIILFPCPPARKDIKNT